MNIINNDLSNNSFSNEAKVGTVRPKLKIIDLLVSILSCFSKIYEKFLLEKFKPVINTFLSKFIAAYRENYSSSHVLIRLIENWKQALDENFVAGTVLMDLAKAFDCIPHDLLIAKLYAYGLSEKRAVFLYSYLKRRKQNVKIDDILSTFQSLISGVPQGSILDPILFNIFLNDLLTTLENSEIYNFADDNTISSISKEKEALLTTLEKESEKVVDWFRRNNMIVNPEKFQSMILERSGNSDVHTIEIDGNKVETTNSVDLLGIHIDNKLTFDDHIFTFCNKASMQLNAIGRLKRYLGEKELEVIVNSFIYSNFNDCPLVWHFS